MVITNAFRGELCEAAESFTLSTRTVLWPVGAGETKYPVQAPSITAALVVGSKLRNAPERIPSWSRGKPMGLLMKQRAAVAIGAITMFVMLGVASLPAFAQVTAPANIDRSTSEALSKHFHKHRLPMVGAQVSVTADGTRHLMLYGYTATDYGKRDAETQARSFLHDPSIVVRNNIRVNPQIRRKKGSAQPPPDDESAQSAPGAGPMDERPPPPPADWERQVDETLRAGGAPPSNDPALKMPAPGGPAPVPPGGSW
jgi:hypothetical protein